jgi:hypothetical protein
MKRGVICVERIVCGKLEWLTLDNQRNYKEFSGCFSVL